MISGEELAAARDRAGLSQKALAKLLGVDVKTVNNWESGRVQPRVQRQKVGDFIAAHPPAREPVVRSITDKELLDEVARRMARPKSSAEKIDEDILTVDVLGQKELGLDAPEVTPRQDRSDGS